LVVAVLRRADGVTFREHAPGRARLDDVRTVLDLIANGRANLVGAVGDAGLEIAVLKSGLEAVLVAVAARDAEGMRGGLHARANHPPFVDRLAERQVVEVR